MIRLSVTDFAFPSPRVGSIDSHSGYRNPAQDGIEIHQAVQKKRREAHKTYEAEVKISQSIMCDEFTFQIEGRMDGIFREANPPHIEEIKSTFNIYELRSAVELAGENHPYVLQLLTYGYFYFLEHKIIPKLSLHLVSTRNRETLDVVILLKAAAYESWLARRLEELTEAVRRAEKRDQRRRKIAEHFAFPFPKPRRGQVELIDTIETGMHEKQNMLLQAPTGLGKTVGVLYPTLKEALARGQRVIYVTPKNSQHSVAEEAVARFQNEGAAIKSLTITAKSKLCLKAEPLCNPTYCEYAKDHYTKVAENGLELSLAKKKRLSGSVFRRLGEKFMVCPYELQFAAAGEAEVVICDYNYVFSPQASLAKGIEPALIETGKPNLVIDEAHNLPSRGAGYYSPALSSFHLTRMREDVLALGKKFRNDAEILLDECLAVIADCRPAGLSVSAPIDPPVTPFLEMDAKLRTFLSRYLESDAEIRPRDVVLRMSFYWREFTEMLEEISETARDEFFVTYQMERGADAAGMLKITCCDASAMLQRRYEDYEHVVAFSATLKPFAYYAKLSGLDRTALKTAEFTSPFLSTQRKLLIIPQISTKFSDRNRHYARIAEVIARVTPLRRGNYFVFFPSFDFLEKVLQSLPPPPGFILWRQARDTQNAEVEKLLEQLKDPTAPPKIIFAVQGGVFSEGVDYPGEMIIGAFVVGPPLPSFDLERETMKKYYETHYGDGFSYAYAYPAMAKAVQSAGRVIRTETDRGLIILMDARFVDSLYSQSMPKDWFKDSPRELISKSILKDVAEFWAAGDSSALF